MAGKIIDPTTQALLERERVLLDDAVAFLTESTPSLEEIGLLVEARKGLEELFLLVIVGEFNAGKSSVINAMLGQKALKEGILPTTNEITVLKFGDKPRTEQSKDGFYTQLIPADLLREVNIVDTPGTNVILERQQRLTEEFVPRADLVLFVLSADRPMTESEVKFLSYIRKWGKKVAFVVNKCDRLENQGEVDEVKGFVADNAERLLGVTDPAVLPVSAKAALAAKEKGGGETDFAQLEDYILSFLGAGDKKGKNSGEGLRLKLGTPLQVGTMLFAAAEEILAQERAEAVEELQQAEGVDAAMDKYREAMEADFGAQVQAVRTAMMGAVGRCDDLLDATLRLTNGADLFTTYVLGNGANGAIRERYKKEVLGDSETKLRAAIKEHTGWLARNNDNQLRAYADAVRARGFDPSATDLNLFEREERIAAEEDAAIAAVLAEVAAKQTAAAEAEAKAAEAKARAAAKEAAGDDGAAAGDGADASNDSSKEDSSKEDEDSSLADSLAGPAPAPTSATSLITRASSDLTSPATVAAGFDQAGAARLLEEEVKDAVYSTVGAAGASFFFAVFLSGFLDNFAEDVLAFSLTAAVGYVSVLSLPLKRAETKAKARAVAESFLDEVEAAMKAEFERKVGATTAQVRATTAPWVASAREAEAAVAASQSRRDRISEGMDQLQRDVQSI
uniref:G domain-containing protein n=1 Tax=Micromonas pusilla TaxID=38833 RepID=A0A7S0IE60_MICPS